MHRILCVLLLGIAAVTSAEEQPADGGDGWRLVWSDEFEGDGAPDPQRWRYETGFVRNREEQYYTQRPENVRVEGGLLVIEARREALANERHDPDAEDWRRNRAEARYTSASLHTNGTAAWTYGRIAVCARLPQGRGVWPAIWMLGQGEGGMRWPQCGEIDIMEFVGFDPTGLHTTVHTGAFNHVRGTQRGRRTEMPDLHDGFHVFAVDWHPDRLDFHVDGHPVFSFAKEGEDNDVWPFHRPHYLLLNLAVGGGWGGQKGIDDAIFPQRLEIDWVRVYQRDEAPADDAEP